MADYKNRYQQNVPGKFYVDDQCIACDACVMEAEKHFSMNDDDGHAYVIKQPNNEKQLEECLNALDACPVDAIGRDGKED